MGAISADIASTVQVLTLPDLERMRHRWEAVFDLPMVTSQLQSYPNRSIWDPRTGDAVIVGAWRHRDEIAAILGFTPSADPRTLFHHAAGQAAAVGCTWIVYLEWNEIQRPEFYHRVGFELLDSVIAFESRLPMRGPAIHDRLRLEPLDVGDEVTMRALLELDHAAFPWLWINSPAEFLDYGSQAHVTLVGHRGPRGIDAYAGYSRAGDWVHIDRLAVHPDRQGQGVATALMATLMSGFQSMGIRTVGLSTQVGNWRSQRLYGKFGFRRASQPAYHVYGRPLSADVSASLRTEKE